MKKLKVITSILTFILLTFILNGCKGGLRIYDMEAQIRYDSLEIKLNDSARRFSREKQLFRKSTAWSIMFADTNNIQKRAVNELENTFKENDTYYEGVISDKNIMIFSSKRQLSYKDSNKPNIWVLILIIFVTGLLGGLAGPRFHLLDLEVKKGIETIRESFEIIKTQKEKLITTSNSFEKEGLEDNINKFETAITDVENKANDLINVNERNYAYLLFGIIAAALSFVALNLFNSKILDFKSEIDYFIFAGYCLIGAVFAKKWILQLYDNILVTKK